MKHSIRQRVIDPITGMKVTKIEHVTGELGSGIFDQNGKEIFEGDIVQTSGYDAPAVFINGTFWHGKIELHNYVDDEYLEIIGHVDD